MDFLFECGLDEAGRGPLAGPVVAGAVILPPDFPMEILNDSKKLSEKKRIDAQKVISDSSCWGIGVVDHELIDSMNILQASLYAMKLAYEMMILKLPDWCNSHNIQYKKDFSPGSFVSAIADGTFVPDIPCKVRCEPKADGKYPCVMAASIMAKVYRDNLMVEYDKIYPEYGYKKHKGYPTKEHMELCRKLGPSPIQRLSFKY